MKNNPVQNIVREVLTFYVKTSTIALAGSIIGFSMIGVEPARSATFTYSGDTVGKPTWTRPIANGGLPPTSLSTNGTATPYDVFSFTVNASGSYSFTSSSPYDNYGFLYQGSFNPTAQLTNVLIGNDDSAGNGSADYAFTTNLSTGTNYFLVSTGFANSDFGTFTTIIDGLGTVNGGATSVPEPFTIIGTLVGGTAAIRIRKKLSLPIKGRSI
jgi:hypothetical protein